MKKQKPTHQFRNVPIPDINRTHELIQQLKNPQKIAFATLLYYTGCRVSESLKIRKENIKTYYDENTHKQFILITNIPVLKKRGKKEQREVEWPLNPQLQTILDYIVELKDSDRLFNITRATAWNWIHELSLNGQQLYPHYFRHLLNTHLTRYYGFSEPEKRDFFNWKNPLMNLEYALATLAERRQKLSAAFDSLYKPAITQNPPSTITELQKPLEEL